MKNLVKKIGRTPTCSKNSKNDAINNMNLLAMKQNVVFPFRQKILQKGPSESLPFFWVQKWWSLAWGGADINWWVEYLIGNLLLLHGQVADTFWESELVKGRACASDRVEERVLKLSRLSRSSHMYSQTLTHLGLYLKISVSSGGLPVYLGHFWHFRHACRIEINGTV